MKKFLMFLMLIGTVHAATQLGINEKLGTMVPLDLTFINETGERVTLKKLMDGKPTMISLNYFRCAGICTPQLNDMAKMLGRLDLAENTDYKVLTIGFAEDEGYELAAAKRQTMLKTIQRDYVQDAWHFVIGENNSSGILADKVGFTYEKTVSPAGVVDYLHPAALIMLSPDGKVTRYLNGIEQLPFDVKMALMEAGQGKVGPTIAKNLLYCFAYDPKAKTYIFKWEKIAGAIMTLIMLAFFIYLVRTSRREEDHQQNKGDK
ncbi:SCO family protein [Sulfurovum sp.]|uniref:SCO family protein n=1 Tax=Sulfurovum sp. TaxID=1969726 RepID=UPI002867D6EF|nr:SCO family protein [Sulfurovum sp.]